MDINDDKFWAELEALDNNKTQYDSQPNIIFSQINAPEKKQEKNQKISREERKEKNRLCAKNSRLRKAEERNELLVTVQNAEQVLGQFLMNAQNPPTLDQLAIQNVYLSLANVRMKFASLPPRTSKKQIKKEEMSEEISISNPSKRSKRY